MGTGTKRVVVAAVAGVIAGVGGVVVATRLPGGKAPPMHVAAWEAAAANAPKVQIPDTGGDLHGLPTSLEDPGGHPLLTWEGHGLATRLADTKDGVLAYVWTDHGTTTVAEPDGTRLGTIQGGPNGVTVKGPYGEVRLKLTDRAGTLRITDGAGNAVGRLDRDGLTLGNVHYTTEGTAHTPTMAIERNGEVLWRLEFWEAPARPLLLALTRLPMPLRVALLLHAGWRGL